MRCQQCRQDFQKPTRRGTKYCGAACRAVAYRERQRRATQPGGDDDFDSEGDRRVASVQARTPGKAAQRGVGRRVHAQDSLACAGRRIAFDDQVWAQAPERAVGYRLVLPGRDEWDAPRVVPDANVKGSPSFWRLRPFELPDDIRLRSGKLYRLLWVDARGTLVPPVRNRQLPALRFFLGPPDDAQVTKSLPRGKRRAGLPKKSSATPQTDRADRRAVSQAAGEVLRVSRAAVQEQTVRSMEQDQAAKKFEALQRDEGLAFDEHSAERNDEEHVSAADMQSQVSTNPAIADASSVTHAQGPAEIASTHAPTQELHAHVVTSAASGIEVLTHSSAENDEQPESATVPEAASDHPPSIAPMVTVQVGEKTLEVAENTWTAAQAPMETAQAGASCIPTCSPPLTDAELRELTGIVLHTEKYAVFMHAVDCHHAQVFNKPAPTPPEFNLRPDEQQRIQSVAHDPRLSRAAIDLNGAWLGCRMLGPDAMYHLPPPFMSLTQVEAGRITSVLNSPARRSYAAYAAARVEALQTGRTLPPQPASDLHPKVRRQIRQLFSDARLLTLMEHGLWAREAVDGTGPKGTHSNSADDTRATLEK